MPSSIVIQYKKTATPRFSQLKQNKAAIAPRWSKINTTVVILFSGWACADPSGRKMGSEAIELLMFMGILYSSCCSGKLYEELGAIAATSEMTGDGCLRRYISAGSSLS